MAKVLSVLALIFGTIGLIEGLIERPMGSVGFAGAILVSAGVIAFAIADARKPD